MFTIKQHDTRRPLLVNITNKDGTAKDCTGLTCYVICRAKGVTAPIIRGLVTFTSTPEAPGLDIAAGHGAYIWQEGDTDVAATYQCEVETIDADGKRDTTLGFAEFVIEDDIADAPASAAMEGGTVPVTAATLDTTGKQLKTVPVGANVSAWLAGEVKASTVSTDGSFTLTLVAGATYIIKVIFNGDARPDRFVAV
jgi:hypothetical protein